VLLAWRTRRDEGNYEGRIFYYVTGDTDTTRSQDDLLQY